MTSDRSYAKLPKAHKRLRKTPRTYNDYRYQRRPDEQISFGRGFHIKEGVTFTIRGMFYNMFNQTYLADPDSTNARATQVTNSSGAVVSGFGRINTGSSYFLGPRTGRLEARLVF